MLQNSPMCLNLIKILILIALCPHQSTQQAIISKSNTIDATCVYNYTSNGLYTCDLYVLVPVDVSDVLSISGTHLANHTDDDIEGVTNGNDNVYYFNGEVLRKFLNLKRISMYGRNLQEINPSAFEVCPKLERLIISYGNLTNFPPKMLKNCENLKYLEFMALKIETFPEDLFGDTQNLEEFNAAVNQLTSIPEKLLQNMQNLKSFRIGFNNIKELSSNLFINTPNLEEVSVYTNDFSDQGDVAFALNGRINLKYLWLDENNITNFDFRFFAQFQKLQYLSVGNRRTSKLTDISWHSLPASLTDLSVYGIGEEVPENAFERVTNLTTLVLYGYDVTSFHKDTFKPLGNLMFLYLYDTGLKSLHPELFVNQINLSNLLIDGSQIVNLPPGIFTPLVNIGIRNTYNGIEIRHSKIRRLNADSFGVHPHLQNIGFTYNNINEIERGLFSKFHPNLVYAGFNGNECVSKSLSGENLDNHEDLELCYKNWEEIDPNNTTIAPPPTTTPSGCAEAFRKIETFLVIFVSFLGIFCKF